ncbi:MAG TPA: hypothetical protein VK027_09575 [Chitinophagaceae bacterium]|nr:hypothetical protein [Chitinophagaceae bacterium]
MAKRNTIKLVIVWILIGSLSGVILAISLKIPQLLWQNQAYNLLFEVDYIPILNSLHPLWLIRNIFHFVTCILSLYFLFHILKFFKIETQLWAYIIVIGIGSAALFFLTLLSNQTPEISDYNAWVLWALGHVLFSISGWYFIKSWIVPLYNEENKQQQIDYLHF